MGPGTPLVVQWLRLHGPKAGGPGLIPGQGTRSHMPQLKKERKEMGPDCVDQYLVGEM